MVWYFGKQAFAISKDFVKAVWKKDESIDLLKDLSNYSNSDLIQIEIFPILPVNLLDFSYQSNLYDYENPPKPPPKLVWFLESLTNDCDLLVKTREDGVNIVVYKKDKKIDICPFCSFIISIKNNKCPWCGIKIS